MDAATGILNEKGISGLTFMEVAESVGLSTSSATYYFRFKEQLAAAAFEKTLNRIEALVAKAGQEPDPYSRVQAYVRLYIDLHLKIYRGEEQPITLLSEMRALGDPVRIPLTEHYSTIFRQIRDFFGPHQNEAHKAINTARTQHLTEAIYWLPVWLSNYSFADFDRVCERMMELFRTGLAIDGARWDPLPITINLDDQVAPGHADFLRVATRLVSESGYRGASVDRIAAELQVTKGSFYHHLQAKDDLVLVCFSHSYDKIAAVQKNSTGDTRFHRLISIIAHLLQIQLSGEWPLTRTTALQTLPVPVRDAVYTRSNRAANSFAGIIMDGISEDSIRSVDPLVAGQIVMSTLNAAYELHNWADRWGDPEVAVRLYASPLVYGLFDDRVLDQL